MENLGLVLYYVFSDNLIQSTHNYIKSKRANIVLVTKLDQAYSRQTNLLNLLRIGSITCLRIANSHNALQSQNHLSPWQFVDYTS